MLCPCYFRYLKVFKKKKMWKIHETFIFYIAIDDASYFDKNWLLNISFLMKSEDRIDVILVRTS